MVNSWFDRELKKIEDENKKEVIGWILATAALIGIDISGFLLCILLYLKIPG